MQNEVLALQTQLCCYTEAAKVRCASDRPITRDAQHPEYGVLKSNDNLKSYGRTLERLQTVQIEMMHRNSRLRGDSADARNKRIESAIARRKTEERKRERQLERQRVNGRRWLVIRLVIAVAAVAFIFYGSFRLYDELRRYRSVELLRENKSFKSYDNYTDLDSCVLAYGTGGMCCIGKDGSVIWRTNYSMREPKAVTNGSYGVVADIAGREAIIFNTSGITGRAACSNPILNIAVSSFGVLALAQDAEEGEGGIIGFYRQDGSELDIRIGTTMSMSGYPLEMVMSPSGKRLVVAGAVIGQGGLQSRVTFYDLSDSTADEAGKTTAFTYSDTLFPSMVFMSEDKLCAIGDDRLCFFGYGEDGKPSIDKETLLRYEIVRAMPSSSRIGLLMKGDDSDTLIFRQYTANGRRVFDKAVPATFKQAYYSGKYAVFMDRDSLMVMTGWGRVRYESKLSEEVMRVRFTGERTFLQISSNRIKELKLS